MKSLIKCLAVLVLMFVVSSCASNNNQDTLSTRSYPILEQFLADSTQAAVLKFHAEWCGTCKQYAPSFEEAKEKFAQDSVDFYEIDIDKKEYKELLKELKVSRIPDTFFVSADRKKVKRRLGPIAIEELSKRISILLI